VRNPNFGRGTTKAEMNDFVDALCIDKYLPLNMSTEHGLLILFLFKEE